MQCLPLGTGPSNDTHTLWCVLSASMTFHIVTKTLPQCPDPHFPRAGEGSGLVHETMRMHMHSKSAANVLM